MENLELINLESSMANLAAYDKPARTLYIRFNSGTIYRYEGCGKILFAALKKINRDKMSVGKFISEYIVKNPHLQCSMLQCEWRETGD